MAMLGQAERRCAKLRLAQLGIDHHAALGGNHGPITAIFESFADDLFGCTETVNWRGVDEVDARIDAA